MLPSPAADRSNSLRIFDERAGIPLTFQAIRYWERFLRRHGIKRDFSRVLATCSIMSLPLILLVIRQLPYRPLSGFWAVWLTMCDSLIVLLSWLNMGRFRRNKTVRNRHVAGCS